ncbi:hypothetical protein [Rhodobium gokarnense]|uniref:Uncharacterized protein n=1 Tax=Rhodobium gokarnense TaxID=364296 RepID=A0ABT3HE40_9HYPH|nr:hypothetical protein [Rhodobium gokarnense]MCW2308661.1 hypothetical protein [Rhodobium gokarnense]
MYVLKPGIKRDPERRWALPDRIFFGFGACHILAGVFLRRSPLAGFYGERVVPDEGFSGNHIFVTDGTVAFDFHGYVLRERLVAHHCNCWRRQQAGWHGRMERVDFDLLDTADLNRRKMLGPDQYFGDAVARAERFLARVDHAKRYEKAAGSGGCDA